MIWCEYGTPGELPNIYQRKEDDVDHDKLPDYRIICLFVDKQYARDGRRSPFVVPWA